MAGRSAEEHDLGQNVWVSTRSQTKEKNGVLAFQEGQDPNPVKRA